MGLLRRGLFPLVKLTSYKKGIELVICSCFIELKCKAYWLLVVYYCFMSVVVRHHFSVASKPEVSENSTCEGDSLISEQLECSVPTENLELAVELPNTLKLSCGSPENNAELLVATNAVAAPESIVQSVIHHSKGGHSSFEREAHLRRICRAGFDWEMLISDATDLLNFDSPTIEENSAEEVPKTVDPGVMTFISNILQENHNDTEMTESVGPIDSSEQCELEKFSASEIVCDLMEIDQAPEIVSRPFLNLNVNPSDTVDDKRQKCIPPSRKVIHWLDQYLF